MQKAPALGRFRVLDLTRVRSGPTAVRQLADWGADVIKIEPPDGDRIGGDRNSSDFQNLHRNKRSLALDLKSADGLATLKRLVATADVLVENFRPDVKDRLGIGYDHLRPINPRLVYASISGYGQTGPYRLRPGVDQIAQGMGGLMAITGEPGGGPVRAGIAVADSCAGLYCAIGILTALLEREVSGEGQWVQTSLLQAQIALLDFQAARWTMDGQRPPQVGNHHPTVAPMGAFPTSDGHVNIAPLGDAMWRRSCDLLGHPEWAEEPRFANAKARVRHRADLIALVEEATRARTTAAWVEAFNRADIPCGPIYEVDEVFADPQVRHLALTERVSHPTLGDIDLIGQPIRMSRSEAPIRSAAPALGADSTAIRAELDAAAAPQTGSAETAKLGLTNSS